ncbi:MAG: hypothetical protein R2874_15355 [Desulfobacterales bacterium]
MGQSDGPGPNPFAEGEDDDNPAKFFQGNRPSSTLILKDLSRKISAGYVLF